MAKLELSQGPGIDLQEVTDTNNEKLIISSYFSVYTCTNTNIVPQNIENYRIIAVTAPYSSNNGAAGANYTYYIVTHIGSFSTNINGTETVTKSRIYTSMTGSGTISATKVGDADWTWTIST